jgi:hypothetical protein
MAASVSFLPSPRCKIYGCHLDVWVDELTWLPRSAWIYLLINRQSPTSDRVFRRRGGNQRAGTGLPGHCAGRNTARGN